MDKEPNTPNTPIKPNVDWYEKYTNASALCYELRQEVKKLKQVITILIQEK